MTAQTVHVTADLVDLLGVPLSREVRVSFRVPRGSGTYGGVIGAGDQTFLFPSRHKVTAADNWHLDVTVPKSDQGGNPVTFSLIAEIETYTASGRVFLTCGPFEPTTDIDLSTVPDLVHGTTGVVTVGGPKGDKGDPTTIVEGAGISVDDTDPANPIVSATFGGTYGELTGKPSIPSTPADIGAASAAALTAETSRASAAEGVNATAISAETTRATGAESTLTTSVAGKVPTTRTVNGHALSADVTVTKADVGLGSVDNTSDAGKPISTATATALAAKADLVGGTVPDAQIPDAGVAALVSASGSATHAALSATYATVLTAISGETPAATTTRVNAALAAASPYGARRTVIMVGDFTHNGPLVISSNTLLDTTRAVLTLASSSLDNGIINAAVQNTRRITDAVTNATTTLTSATAAFVAGDVGKTIRIWNTSATGGYFETTIASRTNGTTVILTAAPSFSGTAQYASIGSRDSNIVLRAGRLVRQSSNYVGGSNGWKSHHVRFRHVDNLDIDVHDINVASGKYAVNAGDCTDVRVRRIYASSTASDVLHLNGPIARVVVDEVVADATNDDVVSLTASDFWTPAVHQLADTYGTITDVTIAAIKAKGDIVSSGSPRGLLILAGKNSDGTQAFACKRVTIGRFDGAVVNYPVWIGGDAADVTTVGGTYEDINICANGGYEKAATPPGAFVRVRNDATSVLRLTVGPVANDGGTYDVEIGAPVTGLTTTGISRQRISSAANVTAARILGEPPYGKMRQTKFSGTIYNAVETADRRMFGTNDTVTLTSGILELTYFRPDEITFAIDSVGTFTRGTASATPTLARIGIYSIDSSGNLTLIGSTPNDTTLWSSTFATYRKQLSSPVAVSALSVYALGFLYVGTTAPGIVGRQLFSGGTSGAGTPVESVAWSVSGQSDLPSSIAVGSLATTEGKLVYAQVMSA